MRRSSIQSPRTPNNLIYLNGHKRHPTINTKPKQSLKLKIDHMLNKDYNNWKQKQTNFNVLESYTAKNTQSIHQYIQEIYIDYQIKDPLQNHNRQYQNYQLLKYESQQKINPQINHNQNQQSSTKPRTSFTFGNINTSVQKVTFQNPIPNRNVYTTPQKPIQQTGENMNSSVSYGIGNRVKFIQKTAPSLTSSSFHINQRGSFGTSAVNIGSFNNNGKDSRMNKSRLSIDNRFNRISQSSQDTPNKITQTKYTGLNGEYQRQYSQNIQSQILFSSNKMQNQRKSDWLSHVHNNTLINDSYRYCIGCQYPILQNNINYHQNTCLEYQNIIKIDSISQIIVQIDKKISRLCQQIQNKKRLIKTNDYQQIQQSSTLLIQQIQRQNFRDIRMAENSENFNTNYQKVIQIGKKWSLLTQDINKLKWFLIIRRNMQSLKQTQNK